MLEQTSHGKIGKKQDVSNRYRNSSRLFFALTFTCSNKPNVEDNQRPLNCEEHELDSDAVRHLQDSRDEENRNQRHMKSPKQRFRQTCGDCSDEGQREANERTRCLPDHNH